MPPDSPGEKGGLAPALVASRWGGYVGGQRPARAWGAIRQVRPLPATLLVLLVGLLDAAAVGLGGVLLQAAPGGDYAARPGLWLALFLALLVPALTAAFGGYAPAALYGRGGAMAALAGVVSGTTGLALAALALGAETSFPPALALAWLILSAPPLLAGRFAAAALLRSASRRTRRRAVLVGDGPQAARFAMALHGRPDRSLELLGIVGDGPAALPGSGLPHLGGLPALLSMIRRGEVDQVILALPWAEEARQQALLEQLADYPVDIRLAPDLMAYRATAGDAANHRLLRLRDRPIRGWGAAVKLAEDYLLASLGLAIAAVPMLLIAAAIRLESPGPALFRQRRTGFNNREFEVLKFRSLHHAAADHGAERQVTEGDPRVTRVGAMLRRTSLDELPQLLNVLRGEMSIIGPRPHAPGTRAAGRPFEQVVARYAARHRVKPGLTGLAQVRGWRGPTETEEKLIRRVESDLEYIDRWSPWLDVTILVRTLVAVVRMRNAC